MNMVDILAKKREGKELTEEELRFSFYGYMNGDVPDYQMSSLLMAICIHGLSDAEVFALTDLFINSGDVLDLSSIEGAVVDKHSTGGVGDKTTLIVGPIVASLGVHLAKLSGRGLGFTGGTIDKLESIPGFRVDLTEEEFLHQVNKIGIAIASQTANLTPLDKMIYALRDVTGTVESIPLIAISIMSKKIASGAPNIMLDVKVGSGALLKTKEEALAAARLMKKIGTKYNRHVETLVTYMDIPLGTSVGNALEVVEAMKILKGGEDNYLVALCKSLAAQMVAMGKQIDISVAQEQVEEVIKNGKAYDKFVEMVESQGGDLSKLSISKNIQRVYSPKGGCIVDMDAYQFGRLSLLLGAGRLTKEDKIDSSVGIVLNKKIGDFVKPGDVLCTLCLKKDAPLMEIKVDDFYIIEEDFSDLKEEKNEADTNHEVSNEKEETSHEEENNPSTPPSEDEADKEVQPALVSEEEMEQESKQEPEKVIEDTPVDDEEERKAFVSPSEDFDFSASSIDTNSEMEEVQEKSFLKTKQDDFDISSQESFTNPLDMSELSVDDLILMNVPEE